MIIDFEKIKAAADRNGMSIEELAAALHLQYLLQMDTSKERYRNVRFCEAGGICIILGCRIDDIRADLEEIPEDITVLLEGYKDE